MDVQFDDNEMASAILVAPDAEAAKRMSHIIKGVESTRWDGMKEGIPEELLIIKFAPYASGNKLLGDTGRGKFDLCSLSINNTNIIDTSKWNGNVIRKLLSKIRLKLKG